MRISWTRRRLLSTPWETLSFSRCQLKAQKRADTMLCPLARWHFTGYNTRSLAGLIVTWFKTMPVTWCVCWFLSTFAKFRKATICFVMPFRLSVCLCLSTWNNSVRNGRLLIKFYIWAFIEKLQTRRTSTLHEYFFTFMITSSWILLRMRNALNKSYRENHSSNFMYNYVFFRKSCCLWDNVEKYSGGRETANDNMAARCMLD